MVCRLFYKSSILTLIISVNVIFSAQAQNTQSAENDQYLKLSWKEVATKMPDAWYKTKSALRVLDSILKYQTPWGGWPKNLNFHSGVNKETIAEIQKSGIGATFDNGATITEIKFLTKVYAQTRDKRCFTAIEKAFNYILKAQYANGGWPQFYPARKGDGASYSSHITFNDDAMLNVMQFLKDLVNQDTFYASLPFTQMQLKQAKLAFDKGLNCILKTQIKVNQKPTVWCAQHDEVSLKPAKARAYELVSFSGQESAGLVLLLMEIPHPTPEIIQSVKGAVNWFKQHEIKGIKLEEFNNKDNVKDLRVVKDTQAPVLWARFYDLATEEPFFCDRDGIKRKTFAELGYNRRVGYRWYTSEPQKVINNYQKWGAKWQIN